MYLVPRERRYVPEPRTDEGKWLMGRFIELMAWLKGFVVG
jgi:hypothetical protein